MKHLHMLCALATLVIFAYQAAPILLGKIKPLSKATMIFTHLIYSVLMISGLWLFWQLYQVAGVQHWAIAKLVLLIVAVSATIKAQRQSSINHAKAGALIALVAYTGIVFLAVAKPVLA